MEAAFVEVIKVAVKLSPGHEQSCGDRLEAEIAE